MILWSPNTGVVRFHRWTVLVEIPKTRQVLIPKATGSGTIFRGCSSAGEHLLCKQPVVGSNPTFSTKV